MNPEDYAIVIGIENYSSLPVLSDATKDATQFARWLQDPVGGGLDEKKIRLILSPPQIPTPPKRHEPYKELIDEAFTSFKILATKGRVGRRLYFYFSGHGYGQDDDLGMFMVEASEDQANLNIGLRHYRNFLMRWGFWDEIVFILDCCRTSDYDAIPQHPSFTLRPPFPTPPPPVEDFVAFATLNGTPSFNTWDESQGRKRGILTKALLEGLADKAVDGLGRITASSLGKYIKDRVPVIAKDNQVEQGAQHTTPHEEIIFKENIIITRKVGVAIPSATSQLIIWTGDFIRIAQYTFNNATGNWDFIYITAEPKLMIAVRSGNKITKEGNDTIIWIDFQQGGMYGLQPIPGDPRPLDLREEQKEAGDFIFKAY